MALSFCKSEVTSNLSWSLFLYHLAYWALGQAELFIWSLTAFSLFFAFAQRKNGLMDHEDFRACLISMGYDLVRHKPNFSKGLVPYQASRVGNLM